MWGIYRVGMESVIVIMGVVSSVTTVPESCLSYPIIRPREGKRVRVCGGRMRGRPVNMKCRVNQPRK